MCAGESALLPAEILIILKIKNIGEAGKFLQ